MLMKDVENDLEGQLMGLDVSPNLNFPVFFLQISKFERSSVRIQTCEHLCKPYRWCLSQWLGESEKTLKL